MIILFVDDDPEDAELFCEAVRYLNSSEFLSSDKVNITCLTASDGRKAVDMLSSLNALPDYIFLDINMPLMDGKKCLAFLKGDARFSQIPVIMLSTAFRNNETSELMALGASDCIVKPTQFNSLVKILSKYIYHKIL